MTASFKNTSDEKKRSVEFECKGRIAARTPSDQCKFMSIGTLDDQHTATQGTWQIRGNGREVGVGVRIDRMMQRGRGCGVQCGGDGD